MLLRVVVATLVCFIMAASSIGCGKEVTVPATENTMMITGVVTAPSGTPENGVEVKLFTYHLNPVLEYLPPTGHVINSTLTTGEGRYQMEVNPDLLQKLLKLGYNKLVVYVAPGTGGFRVVDLAACSVEVNLVTGGPAPAGGQTKQLTGIIASIADSPISFDGQTVTITGYYRGWDLLHEANTAPPVTRSDWVIKDGSGALYVSAISEVNVDGLNPGSYEDTTVIMTVIGVVHVIAEGQPYLEAISIQRLY